MGAVLLPCWPACGLTPAAFSPDPGLATTVLAGCGQIHAQPAFHALCVVTALALTCLRILAPCLLQVGFEHFLPSLHPHERSGQRRDKR